MKTSFSPEERDRLEGLVAQVEEKSHAQVVLAVIGRSDAYAELPWKAFALGTVVAALVLVLSGALNGGWSPSLTKLYTAGLLIGCGAAMAMLAILWPGFARCFLPAHRAEGEVRQYAEALFLQREIFATKNRRGILLLVSGFERRVVLLPDQGVREILTEPVLAEVIATMVPLLKKRRVALALETGLEGIERHLAGRLSQDIQGGTLDNAIIEEKGS